MNEAFVTLLADFAGENWSDFTEWASTRGFDANELDAELDGLYLELT
jgi:hypothetical protein